jgi:hypothetical protein
MRLSRKKLHRALAVCAAGLTILCAQAGTASADITPTPGHAHRTVVTDEGGTFHLKLESSSTTVSPSGSIAIAGDGYNTGQGIILAFCVIPVDVEVGDPSTYNTRSGPCLPGQENLDGSARRITNDATGTPYITIPYGPNGSFLTSLDNLRPVITNGIVCDVNVRCAIVTRTDHTATQNRLYDQYIPVHFPRK